MSIWDAIVLGVIQGLTEFLPISSTAHLVVARQLMGHANSDDAFTVVIQLGTLVAVVLYFRADLLRMARAVLGELVRLRPGSTADGRLAWLIVLGTVPAVVVGFLFKKTLKQDFFTLQSIGVVAIVFALLLALAEWRWRRRARVRPPRPEAALDWRDALWVGVWQACALMPGGSRSGTTITGALFAGLDRPTAARFSFLLSVPVILGAGLKDLYDEYKKLRAPVAGEPPSLFASGDDVTALLVGTLVSGVVGYAAVAWLIQYLKTHSTYVFVAYRVILGAVILAALASGVLQSVPSPGAG